MVQVDVFWSYAFGAGFAMAASRQLMKEHVEGSRTTFDSKYFTQSLLFLAIVFVPSGACLLWAFPSWETMHVGDRNLPAWLVTAFTVTNTTQGILGYWVTRKLLVKGRRYLAFLQMPLGYFLMFFILVHGWDGTGYQRFFSYTKEDFLNWEIWNVFDWLISPVGITLYLMGLVLLPWLFYLVTSFMKEGYSLEDLDSEVVEKKTSAVLIKHFLTIVFGYCLGGAIAASLLIHLLGWIIGALLFIGLAYALVIRKGGLLYKSACRLMLMEEL